MFQAISGPWTVSLAALHSTNLPASPPMSTPWLSRSVNQSRLTMPISLSWKGRGTDVRPAVSGCFNACVCVCVHKYWLIAPVHGCFMWSDWLPAGNSLWEGSSWHMACEQTNIYGTGTEKKKNRFEYMQWKMCCEWNATSYCKYDNSVSGSVVFEIKLAEQTYDWGDQTRDCMRRKKTMRKKSSLMHLHPQKTEINCDR